MYRPEGTSGIAIEVSVASVGHDLRFQRVEKGLIRRIKYVVGTDHGRG